MGKNKEINRQLCCVTLYKQHYRDFYNQQKDELPEDIYSSWGYYDGIRINQIENRDDKKKSLELLYEESQNIAIDVHGTYSEQVIPLFYCGERDAYETYMKKQKKAVFFSVAFAKIKELDKYKGVGKAIEDIGRKEKRAEEKGNIGKVLAMSTFDNADIVILAYSNSLIELDNMLSEIDDLEDVEYIHTVMGVSQQYLNTCRKKEKILSNWQEQMVNISEPIDKFVFHMATRKGKEDALTEFESKNSGTMKQFGIEKLPQGKTYYGHGHHNLEVHKQGLTVKQLIYMLLPNGPLSHNNGIIGSTIYNIESQYAIEKHVKTKKTEVNNVVPAQEVKPDFSSALYAKKKDTSVNDQTKVAKLIDKAKTIAKHEKEKNRDTSTFYALISTLNTLSQFELFKMGQEVYTLIFSALNSFLEQFYEFYENLYNNEKENEIVNNPERIKKQAELVAMITYVNSIIQNSVHTDQVFLMIPGYCGSSFCIPTKLALLYRWMAYSIRNILKEEGHNYEIFLVPEIQATPETEEIRIQNTEHTIIVKFGQSMLSQSAFSIILTHEIAHYIGEKERNREKREVDCIELISFLMKKFLFENIKEKTELCEYPEKERLLQIYQDRVQKNIENYLTQEVERQKGSATSYASDLTGWLQNAFFEILNADDERDVVYLEIFGDVYQWMKEIPKQLKPDEEVAVVELYTMVKSNIYQSKKIALFQGFTEAVVEKLMKSYKEIYSDICAYKLLNFSFNEYKSAYDISEGEKINILQISSLQSIRELVVSRIMGRVSDERKFGIGVNLRDTDIIDEMFSYAEVKDKLYEYAKVCLKSITQKIASENDKTWVESVRNIYKMLTKNNSMAKIYEEVVKDISAQR